MKSVKQPAATSLLQRPLDLLYFGFFTSHIVFTLLCDCLVLFPLSLVPDFFLNVNQFTVGLIKDPFMNMYDHQYPGVYGDKYFELMWFRSFIFSEIFFQLPFFFYAAFRLYKDQKASLKIPGIIYCSHVATTVVPLLTIIINGLPSYSFKERATLFSVYSPYLFIPLVLLYDLLTIKSEDINKKTK